MLAARDKNAANPLVRIQATGIFFIRDTNLVCRFLPYRGLQDGKRHKVTGGCATQAGGGEPGKLVFYGEHGQQPSPSPPCRTPHRADSRRGISPTASSISSRIPFALWCCILGIFFLYSCVHLGINCSLACIPLLQENSLPINEEAMRLLVGQLPRDAAMSRVGGPPTPF